MRVDGDVAADGVLELVKRYGAQTVADCMADAVDASEMRLRARLRELPSGTYEGEYFIDDDGIIDERIRIVTKVTIEDGSIHVDFTGTSGMSSYAINCPLCYTEAYTTFGVNCIVAPHIPNNTGTLDAVHVTAPEGTILSATHPAAV